MTTPAIDTPVSPNNEYEFGFHDDVEALVKLPKGLSREVVNTISDIKNEPEWMRKLRLKALDHFNARPMPEWGGELNDIDFDDIHYYVRATDRDESSWDDVPDYIRDTYDKLGIPEAEKQGLLAGVGAQYDSEVVYHNIREDLEEKGVLFLGTDQALSEYPDLVKEYFTTVIPPNDNKFAALNTAVWSGGSFIYVPPGVNVDIPLQAYFRINSEDMGQFERTLIIADEAHRCTTSRAVPLRSTPPTRSTRRSSRSSARRVPTSATRRSRTGRTTSTTLSPSERPPTGIPS